MHKQVHNVGENESVERSAEGACGQCSVTPGMLDPQPAHCAEIQSQ